MSFIQEYIIGKFDEHKLDLGKDLRNNWNKKSKYPDSDITNKYNIKRKVTFDDDKKEYYSNFMDIYINSENKIVYAVPKDISSISYITKDEIGTDAAIKYASRLEGKKINNINNIIDSLDEPNYAIVTNDGDSTKLTYVWYVFENHYFYYQMQVNYYIMGAGNKFKMTLSGESIENYKYGVVNKDYIYYTSEELALLFDAIENNYNQKSWIQIDK